MRIGNLEPGRPLVPRHRRLLEDAECDVWLLTVVPATHPRALGGKLTVSSTGYVAVMVLDEYDPAPHGTVTARSGSPDRRAVWDDSSMADDHLLARISTDPEICGGRPCVRGHRIWVALILGLLAEGMTTAQILEEYPGLEEDDVRASIAYGAKLAGGRYVDLSPAA